MPIEIKELVIRAVVGGNAAAGSPGDDEGGAVAGVPAHAGEAPSTEEVVQECVRAVLRVLSDNRER